MRIFYTQVHNLIGFFELKYMLKLRCKNSRFKVAKKLKLIGNCTSIFPTRKDPAVMNTAKITSRF